MGEGEWSAWWCRFHRRVEDPFPDAPHAVCQECAHVFATVQDLEAEYTVGAALREQARFCPLCLTDW